MQIRMDKENRELKAHGSYEFPVNISYEQLSRYERGSFSWHWHPEIELTFVLSGQIGYQVPDRAGLDLSFVQLLYEDIPFVCHKAVKPTVGADILPKRQQGNLLFQISLIVFFLDLDKRFQLFQLSKSQRGLKVCHAVIVANLVVNEIQGIILCLGGKVFGLLQIVHTVGNNHAAAAGRDDFVPVKGVNTNITDGSGVPARKAALCIVAAEGHTGILDQKQMIFFRQ